LVLGSPTVSWSLRVWQSNEGLPDNSVVGIGQTQDGFLWVATQGGLVRFDGIEFKELMAAASAGSPSGLMRVLSVDPKDRLWVAKDLGVLLCLDNGKLTTLTTQDGMPLMRAKALLPDDNGGLWIAYSGSEVVRVCDGQLRHFTGQDGLPQAPKSQLACDASGRVWCLAGGEVGVFREQKFLPLVTVPEAQCIAAARGRGVWVGVGSVVYRYAEGGDLVKSFELPTGLHGANPTVIYEDRSGALWVGTSDAGLFRCEGGRVERMSTSWSDISCLAEDREGNLWVGTMGGGLDRLRRSIVELEPGGDGLPQVGFRSVCQDTAGTLWAVDRNGGVIRNRGDGWRGLSTNEGWAVADASVVAATPSGGVWIGTAGNGLHFWHEGPRQSLSRADGLADNNIRSLLVSSNGDLWIGTTREDLQRFRQGKLLDFHLPRGSGSVRAMTLDAATNLWVGTGDGSLLRADCESSVLHPVTAPFGQPAAIRCLRATADGSLWVGYGGAGVARLQADRFTRLRTTDGLHDNYISEILEDLHGHLWFAGNRGIFFVRCQDLDNFSAGRIDRVHSVAFGHDEGVPALQASWEFWPGALRSSDGPLYFAMQTALAVVHCDLLAYRPVLPPPAVVIESVAVDGRVAATYDPPPEGTNSPIGLRRLRPEERIHLPAAHRQVTLAFTAPSFVSPNHEIFKYQLEGLDSDWTEANSRTIVYPHLAPGNYRFRVIACNSDGKWNETGATLELTAEAHFWETTLFRLAAAAFASVVVGGVIYVLLRNRYRRNLKLLEQQRALERERARIAQDLHDDLGAGLVEISLGSELARDPALHAEVAREYTREIGNRAREMVAALDEIVWAVNPKHDNVASLTTYLCQYSQHFLKPTRLSCHLEIAQNLPALPLNSEQRHSLFLAFKEALSNAVQHSGATELRLAVSAEAHHLTIQLSDNGHGFDPAAPRHHQCADGLGNMQRRLAQLRGEYQLSSCQGRGTTVSFKLPLPVQPAQRPS
jgi:signal transduction histidine kinase/ligand-binding sensor domain-containing protein